MQVAAAARRFRDFFPNGTSLPEAGWRRRHVAVLALLAAHALLLPVLGLANGHGTGHVVLEGGLVAALAVAAAVPRLPTRVRSVVASVGLMSASAILVHFSGGYIEAHFHFFVMLGVIFLYEDWLPYSLAVAYVAIHHGVVGTLDPLSVYNHPAALADPWRWAAIHALFIMGLSVALLVAWNVIEGARRSETSALREAQDLRRQLHSQEKMAALGSLVAGLAHEVRTPLTVVASSAALLEIQARREGGSPLATSVLESAAEIRKNVERVNALVMQLRRFHGLPQEEMVVGPIDATVREAAALFVSAHRGTAQVQLDLGPTPPVRYHPLGLHQVVLNLLLNAAEASPEGSGPIVVRAFAERGRAVVEVEDRGCGIRQEDVSRIFEPLFTTKAGGMGLGLHIVARIVEAHGGTVTCRSAPGVGSTFRVALEAAPVPRAASAPAVARPVAA